MKHPEHSYRGMSDMRKCPPFIADYDCQADYIDKKYRQQAEKVPTDNHNLLREKLTLWHVTRHPCSGDARSNAAQVS